MRLKVIITGATGMVGEGVLHECLLHPEVESVLVINRRPCNVIHPKLTEVIHDNFFDFTGIANKLSGYNSCFFCMGVSSVGMKEEKYMHITYDITIALASQLVKLNPGMTMCYVTGAGTDSTGNGRTMWARVKGKTENQLLLMFPEKGFMYRPGYIQPTKGLKNTYKILKVLAFLNPLIKTLFPKYSTSLRQIGLSMINVSIRGYEKHRLECPDINKSGSS